MDHDEELEVTQDYSIFWYKTFLLGCKMTKCLK